MRALVTLHSLLQLAEAGLLDMSWTSHEVVELFVAPITYGSKCCLHDLILDPSSTGHPRYFVSHAWSRTLGELLQLLMAYFNVASSSDPAAGVVLWLDIVALNQYPYEEAGACLLDEDAEVDVVEKVVQATERTLLCLDPGCEALRRSWCLA